MNQIQANIRVLSDDEIARIHNTSMRILSELGLHVPNETVCGMAQKPGAKVDGETVRIPAEALEIAQMAAFYGLTSGSNSGLTDALYPDFQAGFEKSFSAVCSALAGSDAIGGQGIVGADQTFQDGEPIQTARQRAQERAQAIIAENRTDEPVIDGAQCAMLDKIVQDALDHLDA